MTSARAFQAAAVQWSPGEGVEANREASTRLIEAAADAGAELIVLPEYSQYFHPDLAASAAAHAEPLDGPYVATLQEAASRSGVVVVSGFVESAGDAVHNTVVAVGAAGVLAAYRKVHLYDAFGIRESDWLTPGALDQRAVFDIAGQRIGLQTCYDIRFPESSRLLVDAGADVFVVPAEWVRGPQKERHWKTLLSARAIENTVHVIAADHAPPVGAGCSMIIDPMGIALAALGEVPGQAIGSIDPARTRAVREANPSLANRRYAVS